MTTLLTSANRTLLSTISHYEFLSQLWHPVILSKYIELNYQYKLYAREHYRRVFAGIAGLLRRLL